MKKIYTLLIINILLVGNVFAADIYVSASGSNSTGDGSSGNPYFTVGFAVSVATSGDTIYIVGSVSESGQIEINGKSLTFQGQSNAIMERSATGRIINALGTATLIFRNITFQNANASVQGTVFNTTANTINVTFEDCLFQNNEGSAQNGNAIHIGNADASFTRCTFYNNRAIAANGRGAAIIFGGSFGGTITNCTFYQNKLTNNTSTTIGAAVVSFTGTGQSLTITNSLFKDNTNSTGDKIDIQYPSENLSVVNSLAENTNIGSTNNTITDSNLTADFTNTTFSFVSPNVTFNAPNSLSDATPIDFGNDNNDVGAWDSKINIFEGTTNILWSEATNWSSGSAPIGNGTEDIAIIGSNCNMFSSGVAVNNIKVTTELRIQGQNVFIVNGESDVTGIVRYFANLQNDADLTKAWYLVSSPLSGEIFDEAFADRNDITANGTNRAIATYNPGETGAAAWTYLSNTNTSIDGTSGKGFSMKITPDAVTFAGGAGEYADNDLGFEGDFNTNDAGVTFSTLTLGFELLGNPYVAHINSATFLSDNANLDQNQIWVWNQATGIYEAKLFGNGFILAPAQGFFVKVNTTGSVNFAEANQLTSGGTFQKTSKTEVKLLMTDGEKNRFAKLYFTETATAGFDFGWEGEVFGGIPNSLDVFTNLVDGSQGKKYQVQSLPNSDFENMVVPVGIKAAAGKELTFTAEAINLPEGIKVYLEDRENSTLTELTSTNKYKVTVNNALDGTGRFFLHTKSAALSTDDVSLTGISIYSINKSTLRISGVNTTDASVKVYNILGRKVVDQNFSSKGVYDVSLPNLNTGVYIVQLSTEKGKMSKKIILE